MKSEVLLMGIKEALLMGIESSIEWRTQKCVEHREDIRNLNSVVVLEAVAETVKALPANHSLFKKLAEANELGMESWTEQESQFLGRWGFFNEVSPRDSGFRFIAELGDLATTFLSAIERR